VVATAADAMPPLSNVAAGFHSAQLTFAFAA
jgi:hypothetical protein